MVGIKSNKEFRQWLDAHPNGGVVPISGSITFELEESVTIPENTWLCGNSTLGYVACNCKWWIRRLIRWFRR